MLSLDNLLLGTSQLTASDPVPLSDGEETSLKTCSATPGVQHEKTGVNKEFPLMESRSPMEGLQHPLAGSDTVTSAGAASVGTETTAQMLLLSQWPKCSLLPCLPGAV